MGAGDVLAVIQMINKMEFDGEVGRFDEEDIEVMLSCVNFISSKLEGSSLVEKMSHQKKDDSVTEGHMAFDVLDLNVKEKSDKGPGSPASTQSLSPRPGSPSTKRRHSQDCQVIE